MTLLGDRIRYARLALNITQERFAEQLGVSPSTSSRWERGKQRPGWEELEDIAQLCNRRIAWFLEEEPAPRSSRRARRKQAEVSPHQLEEHHTQRSVRLPLYPGIPVGAPYEPLPPAEEFIDVPGHWLRENETAYGLVMKTPAVEPELREGDIVVVRRGGDAESGDIVLASLPGPVDSAGCLYKRLQQVGGRLQLHSINPTVPDPSPDTSFHIDGKVIGLFRAL